MKTIKFLASLLFLLGTLLSCAAPTTGPTSGAAPTGGLATSMINLVTSATIMPIPTITATSTLRPTSTFSPDSTESFDSGSEPTTLGEAIRVCPGEGVPISPPAGFGFSGTIVYQHYYHQGLYTIGGQPLVQSHVLISETQEYDIYGFSPDGSWLAYAPVSRRNAPQGTRTMTTTLVLETPSIILLSASGEKIENAFNFEGLNYQDNTGQWLQIYNIRSIASYPNSYWLNEHLIYAILAFDDPTDRYTHGYAVPILFDPFQDTWLDEALKGLDRFNDGRIGISPDMRRVLYEAKSLDAVSGMSIESGITLRDLDKDEDIWSDPKFPSSVTIRWAPDSSMVAVGNTLFSGDDQLLLLSRDGDSKVIADATFPGYGFALVDLSWSPDSRYLALVTHRHDPEEDVEIYLYDTLTERYIYFCPLVTYKKAPSAVFWSPDSSYIALSSSASKMPLQLFDVNTGKIFKIAEDAIAVGWSDKFPVEWP